MPKRRKFKEPKYPNSERGYWNWFHGTGNRCAVRRRLMRERTAKMFPQGMSIKKGVLRGICSFVGNRGTFLPNTKGEYLNDVHPNAWRYLEMYGVEYKPFAWPERPPMGEPQRKKCFRNAMILSYVHNDIGQEKGRIPRTKMGRARGRHVLYNVQGIALGPLVNPMLHGWNAWGKGRTVAIDWTFYSVNKWTRYIGIPLTYGETLEISRIKGHDVRLISIFDKTSFDLKVRVALTCVMHRRKRAGKQIPIRTKTIKKAWPIRGRKVKNPGKRRGSFL